VLNSPDEANKRVFLDLFCPVSCLQERKMAGLIQRKRSCFVQIYYSKETRKVYAITIDIVKKLFKAVNLHSTSAFVMGVLRQDLSGCW
jgi:hypothetical protein